MVNGNEDKSRLLGNRMSSHMPCKGHQHDQTKHNVFTQHDNDCRLNSFYMINQGKLQTASRQTAPVKMHYHKVIYK